ncbi:hypothetical protein WN51_13914 [Melipona quadrifasciata]|uniref:Uncharacterized protein n=1 Tax=Melipona quadrifasciata TaxID=166423 RepID=A0A0M9A0G9_9HYME|nr:hypothetical protein WN51_13914 [Melipona quadrifasciata]
MQLKLMLPFVEGLCIELELYIHYFGRDCREAKEEKKKRERRKEQIENGIKSAQSYPVRQFSSIATTKKPKQSANIMHEEQREPVRDTKKRETPWNGEGRQADGKGRRTVEEVINGNEDCSAKCEWATSGDMDGRTDGRVDDDGVWTDGHCTRFLADSVIAHRCNRHQHIQTESCNYDMIVTMQQLLHPTLCVYGKCRVKSADTSRKLLAWTANLISSAGEKKRKNQIEKHSKKFNSLKSHAPQLKPASLSPPFASARVMVAAVRIHPFGPLDSGSSKISLYLEYVSDKLETLFYVQSINALTAKRNVYRQSLHSLQYVFTFRANKKERERKQERGHDEEEVHRYVEREEGRKRERKKKRLGRRQEKYEGRVQQLYNTVEKMQASIYVKINFPSHAGIIGNEKVDKGAKEAVDSPTLDHYANSLPPESSLKREIRRNWNRRQLVSSRFDDTLTSETSDCNNDRAASPAIFVGRKASKEVSAGNTIEGGLMEIKTPYRIPYVSQMAALDGVSYRHQPSFGPLRASFPEDLGRETVEMVVHEKAVEQIAVPLVRGPRIENEQLTDCKFLELEGWLLQPRVVNRVVHVKWSGLCGIKGRVRAGRRHRDDGVDKEYRRSKEPQEQLHGNALSAYVRESFAANTQLLESYPDAIRRTERNTEKEANVGFAGLFAGRRLLYHFIRKRQMSGSPDCLPEDHLKVFDHEYLLSILQFLYTSSRTGYTRSKILGLFYF